MFGYVVGVIGLGVNDFWNLDDKELLAIIEEYETNNEQRLKFDLEQNRLSSFYSVAVHNGKIKNPKKLYKFEWEKSDFKLTPELFDKYVSIIGIPKGIEVIV
ncbi:hypothetical protein MM236_01100 [Belliella sp. DSM 107340]|uniref:Uncharacterized protein n=1 Tax=Belliella calami TaxID=2923436 RepID=A0ABS9UIW8_9BACT|nr:hypothetical protein [Belliella calami]MCH7396558.1 hypothetical protein [Belliella calami]